MVLCATRSLKDLVAQHCGNPSDGRCRAFLVRDDSSHGDEQIGGVGGVLPKDEGNFALPTLWDPSILSGAGVG